MPYYSVFDDPEAFCILPKTNSRTSPNGPTCCKSIRQAGIKNLYFRNLESYRIPIEYPVYTAKLSKRYTSIDYLQQW
ncbi:hypothetical protein P879_04704 [Paragonimus westermani]|uniref:Uncharacterized protein n=1 Tax=Paragonimus westermani TaxID=34504 RepID=A0A8T0D783_9TREM|nr:hypothetical protein P879_04704 [Paragonimus westermani]